MNASVRGWLGGLVLLYLSIVILVAGVDAMHLRPDENLVYDFTRNDLSYLITYLAEQDSHPPLWFSSFWLWRQLAGDSEFAGRMLAVFYSMLTLALVYQVGRRWFGAARYGLFAVALLGVNSYFFIYALEIRPYAFIMLLVTASMWMFQRWLAEERWRYGIGYAITLGIMLYVHYFLFVLMIVQVVYFILRWPSRRLWMQAIGVVFVTVLIWLPWLPFAVYQVLHVRQAEITGGNARGVLGAGSTTMPTSLNAVRQLANVAFNGQVALYGVVLLAGLVMHWRKANYRLALVWALGVPAVSLLVNLVVAVFLPRYVVYMVIGLALVLAAGLAGLVRQVRWPALGIICVVSLLALPTQLRTGRVPYRDMFQQVSLAAGPDDVIFFDEGDISDGFVRAQIRRYLDPDLWRRRVSSIDEALSHRRIWYVTDGEWFTDRTRERFARIEATHPLQEVIGRCDREWCYLLQLMETAPYSEPVVFGDALAFWGMDVDSTSADALSVRLWWMAQDTIPLDYSIGLHLLDSNGQLAAQADGAITDQYSGETVQTSQLVPGKLTIDVRPLPLPPDLPPGEYQPVVIVYQTWDNTRLTLADGADRWTMEAVHLP